MVTPTLGLDIPTEPLLIINTIAAPIVLMYNRQYQKINFRSPLLWLLFFQFAWSIVAAINASDWLLSAKYIVAKIWYIVPCVLLVPIFINCKKNILIWCALISLPMVFIAAKTVLQHATTNFSFDTINNYTSPFFRNHVNYSAMLVTALPMLVLLYKYAINKKYKTILIGSIILILVAILFSYTRAAWLSIFASLFAVFLIKKHFFFKAYFLGSLAVLLFFIGMSKQNYYLKFRPDYNNTIFHADIKDHLISTFKGNDLSTAERYYRWIAAIRLWNENKLLGIGPNHFYPAYKNYTVGAFRTWVSANTEHSGIHQYFLLILAEQGLPGLLIHWCLTALIFYIIEKKYNQQKTNFNKNFILVLGFIFLNLFIFNMLNDLIETDKLGILWFTIIGLLSCKQDWINE